MRNIGFQRDLNKSNKPSRHEPTVRFRVILMVKEGNQHKVYAFYVVLFAAFIMVL